MEVTEELSDTGMETVEETGGWDPPTRRGTLPATCSKHSDISFRLKFLVMHNIVRGFNFKARSSLLCNLLLCNNLSIKADKCRVRTGRSEELEFLSIAEGLKSCNITVNSEHHQILNKIQI